MLVILRDVCGRMSPLDVDELIAVAERRSGLYEADRARMDLAVSRLTSQVGRWFIRRILLEGSHDAPKPQSTEANLAVVDAAFELAAAKAMGRRLSDHEIEEWATVLTDTIPEVSRNDIVSIVRKQCGYSFTNINVDPDYENLVKVASTTAALQQMGLLDSEVQEVLIAAEELARRRGFMPAPYDG